MRSSGTNEEVVMVQVDRSKNKLCSKLVHATAIIQAMNRLFCDNNLNKCSFMSQLILSFQLIYFGLSAVE